jgi:hypothetical protein
MLIPFADLNIPERGGIATWNDNVIDYYSDRLGFGGNSLFLFRKLGLDSFAGIGIIKTNNFEKQSKLKNKA